MSSFPELLGVLAGLCTTGAFVPQVLQTWKTRSTKDISLPMYAVIVTGSALWLAYGLVNHDMPLIVANTVTIVLQGAILALKIRNG